MHRIPEKLVQEILDKTDIIGVVSPYVTLANKGGRWVGLCPFHRERTPSFSVDREKGLFYCFGCQKGGSTVQFLMEMDSLTFPEAIRELGERAGIKVIITEEDKPEDTFKSSLHELNQRIAKTFAWLMHSTEEGRPALELLKSRGLSNATIERFQLGYAPEQRKWLFGFLQEKGYSQEFLNRSGFFDSRNQGYSLFAGRLMFPIADKQGRIIGFGGRALSEHEKIKYINSAESALFKKQESLYAFDQALTSIKKEGYAILCEGYMDAISLHEAGEGCAVATLGTAFSQFQARILKRSCPILRLGLDSDDAGVRATERIYSIAAAEGFEVQVVRWENGKDPSEILQKMGAEPLRKEAKRAISAENFLLNRIHDYFDVSNAEGKSKAASYVFPFINSLDTEIKRAAFLDTAARSLGLSPEAFARDFRTSRERTPDTPKKSGGSADFPHTKRLPRSIELVLMTAIVINPAMFVRFRLCVQPDELEDRQARDLYFALEECYRRDQNTTAMILERVEDEEAKRAVLDSVGRSEFKSDSEKFILEGIATLQKKKITKRKERLLYRLTEYERSGEKEDSAMFSELLFEIKQCDLDLEAIKGERK